MEDLLKRVNEYLSDLDKDEDRLNGNIDLLIGYFHDANELLVELKTLQENKS